MDKLKCGDCGATEDDELIGFTDDGEALCTDCMFESMSGDEFDFERMRREGDY